MDFISISNDQGMINNPFSAKCDNEWIAGQINAEFLQTNFGQFNTATEMKNATESEGLKLFFSYLAEQGKIQA